MTKDDPYYTPPTGGSHAFTWGEYRVWAKTARGLQKTLRASRRLVLRLMIAAAMLGVCAEQSPAVVGFFSPPADDPAVIAEQNRAPKRIGNIPQAVFSILAAIALGFAGIISSKIATPETLRNQVRARSTAEALKSKTYLYVTGVPPYDGPVAHNRLWDDTNETLKAATGLRSDSVTDDERGKGLPDFPLSVADYLIERISGPKGQIRWYHEKADENVKKAQTLNKLVFVSAFVGCAFGAVAVANTIWPPLGLLSGWIPVFSAISASVASHMYAERYDYLEMTYRSTARQLTRLRDRWNAPHTKKSDPETQHQFFQDCELAISIENQAWMADLLQPVRTNETDPTQTSGDGAQES